MNFQSAVIEYERRLIEAQRTSNVNELDLLLHDDLLFTIPNGLIITKEIDLESHRSGDMTIHSSTTLEQRVRLIEDIAVAVSTIELKGQYKEQLIDGRFVYNRVWKQFSDRWKLIAGSAVQIE